MSKQSQHHFNVEDAEQYGVECAVLLFNIRFWLDKNKANEKHIHDGRVWTYNSTKAFSKLFPYLSEKQIYRRLKKLEKAGILKTGNYNKNSYDQTKWYSVDEPEYCISDNEKNEFPKSENESSESGKPIPDNKPDSKPDSKQDDTADYQYNGDFKKFWNLYDLKKGKKKAKQEWQKLANEDIEKIFKNVPIFLTHFSSKQYTPRPRKYLYNRYWEDEAYQQKGDHAEEKPLDQQLQDLMIE